MLSGTVDEIGKIQPAVNPLKDASTVFVLRASVFLPSPSLSLFISLSLALSFSFHPRLDECIMRACSSPRIPVKSLISCPCGLAFSLSRAGMLLLRICE